MTQTATVDTTALDGRPVILWTPGEGMDEFGEEGAQTPTSSVAPVPVPLEATPPPTGSARRKRPSAPRHQWWPIWLGVAMLAVTACAAQVTVWALTATTPPAAPAPAETTATRAPSLPPTRATAPVLASVAAAAPTGTIVVESEPSGLDVRVDGKPAGTTPIRMVVPSGSRTVRVMYRDAERSVVVPVAAGETVRQRVEFIVETRTVVAEAAAQPPQTLPRPAAARAVAAPRASPSGALSGWLRVESPAVLRLFESGQLMGTTDVDRLMLPVGEHQLELRSDELGFTTRHVVVIKAGETSTVPVRLPSAPISINAKPWAEVWVDGEPVGETPIGTLLRPLGRHEVVLKHPELGERRHTVLVTTGQPARLTVDLTATK